LHVLPSGFHRIRHYGMLANIGRRDNLQRARELLKMYDGAIDTASQGASLPAESARTQPTFICPDCGAAMVVVGIFAREQLIRAPP
jgi:predicted RNA-binding Zn-ribbon protein involved in translation (DUF1610 family)